MLVGNNAVLVLDVIDDVLWEDVLDDGEVELDVAVVLADITVMILWDVVVLNVLGIVVVVIVCRVVVCSGGLYVGKSVDANDIDEAPGLVANADRSTDRALRPGVYAVGKEFWAEERMERAFVSGPLLS